MLFLEEVQVIRAVTLHSFSRLVVGTPWCHIKHFLDEAWVLCAVLDYVQVLRAVTLHSFSRLGVGTPWCHIKHFSR